MNTQPLNQNSAADGKKWTRAQIAAAVAAGVITTEAANALYDQLANDPVTPVVENEEIDAIAQDLETIAEEIPRPETVAIPEPQTNEPASEPAAPAAHTPESPASQVHTPENNEPALPTPTTTPEQNGDNVIDIIVQEIDPNDKDTEDILIEDYGMFANESGDLLFGAFIQDENGGGALIDMDGDGIFDKLAYDSGKVYDVQNTMNISDVEPLYAQQHGETGYMEQNPLDIALNQEADNQDDVMLT